LPPNPCDSGQQLVAKGFEAYMRSSTADVAFTNASPARQKEMSFGPHFLIIELGYLVPAGSTIASSTDVDKHGVRVGVTAGSTSEGTLSRVLKHAELVRATTNQDGAGLLAAGKIDAFATNKATLFDLADKTPGIKVLPVLIFDQANATQPSLECFDERTVVRVGRRAERNECKPDWASVLLRARRERPYSRAAEQRDELAPFHWQYLPCFPSERIAHSARQETAALQDFNPPDVGVGSIASDQASSSFARCPLYLQ
jgi:Bacterial extracellular solute-binding proteins, family 3